MALSKVLKEIPLTYDKTIFIGNMRGKVKKKTRTKLWFKKKKKLQKLYLDRGDDSKGEDVFCVSMSS